MNTALHPSIEINGLNTSITIVTGPSYRGRFETWKKFDDLWKNLEAAITKLDEKGPIYKKIDQYDTFKQMVNKVQSHDDLVEKLKSLCNNFSFSL